MVKVIVADSKLDCEHLLGQYLDESHFDILINEDTDCFMEANCGLETKVSCDKECSDCDVGADERRFAFKFRKNFFTKQEQEWAYEGLYYNYMGIYFDFINNFLNCNDNNIILVNEIEYKYIYETGENIKVAIKS